MTLSEKEHCTNGLPLGANKREKKKKELSVYLVAIVTL